MYLHLFFRTSPKDDEQHQSSNQESTNEIRDPFALQIHPQKNWSTPIEQDPSSSLTRKSFRSISSSSLTYLDDEHNHSPKAKLHRKYNQVMSFVISSAIN